MLFVTGESVVVMGVAICVSFVTVSAPAVVVMVLMAVDSSFSFVICVSSVESIAVICVPAIALFAVLFESVSASVPNCWLSV